MGLSDNIKKYRELRNLSAEQLATEMGVRKQNVYNWESGKHEPSLKLLTEMSKVLHTSVADLLGESVTEVKKSTEGKENIELSPEDVYRKIVEGGTEYLLIPKTAFEGEYRLVHVEHIEAQAKEVENHHRALEKILELFRLVVSGRPIDLAKIEDTKKDTSVGDSGA